MQYALLAELGYEVAQSNAAVLLDRGEVPMLTTEGSMVRALLYWGRAAAQGYSAAQVSRTLIAEHSTHKTFEIFILENKY